MATPVDQVRMAMDTVLMKSGAWLIALLLAVGAAAYAVDGGFAAQMWIVAIAALVGLAATLGRTDYEAALGVTTRPRPTGYYDNVIRLGVIATVFWGLTGLLVGFYIALQLAFPQLNLGLEYTSFGRLRPLHTSAVIFAFGGNALIASSFYIVQRTCRARLAFPKLADFVFWGYQLFIVLAATGYLLGITEGREYAEPEWYVDIWLTIIWVSYLAVFIGTIVKRNEPHIYVANWFYLSFIVTIAMLHLVNNLTIPVSLVGSKSYSAFAGVQDALTQWWYGHNAVGFFLTAGFLGMMYYFVPKQAERPIYSYRLSIVHFWSLIFLYIWAGPHHLHYTALPDWAQTLGMVFSVMLWMPSWDGMINGLMTLNGAWDKVRTDPIIRMMVLALAFYGMSISTGGPPNKASSELGLDEDQVLASRHWRDRETHILLHGERAAVSGALDREQPLKSVRSREARYMGQQRRWPARQPGRYRLCAERIAQPMLASAAPSTTRSSVIAKARGHSDISGNPASRMAATPRVVIPEWASQPRSLAPSRAAVARRLIPAMASDPTRSSSI